MSSLGKTLALLDLFGPDSLHIDTDLIAEATGMSKATVYRYARDLCDAGLLTRVANGRYGLGPRIIELDWMMRQYDPILIAARDVMHALSRETRLTVFSSVFYDGHIINTYIVEADDDFALDFARGQPLPLFLGAQSKVLVGHLKGKRLERLFHDKIASDAANPYHDMTWPAFARATKKIRRDGYSLTTGEITKGLTGIAAPILQPDGKEAVASLCAVGNETKFLLLRHDIVIERVVAAAKQIASNIAHAADVCSR